MTTTAKTTTKKTATPRSVTAVNVNESATKKPAAPLSAPVYTMAGKQAGTVSLPETVFGVPWKADLVHQVVTAMQANARPTVAHTKTRGEVRGGGKKPWKQKGTGRARHGSSRSPIWRGGGTTHGPRAERSYTQKINRKMRAGALASVLSRKFKDGKVLFVDTLSFDAPKTKDAKVALVAIAKAAGTPTLATRRAHAALIAFSSNDLAAKKSFTNFGNLLTEDVRNINPVEVLRYQYLLIEKPAEALEALSARLSSAKRVS
ncbi:MAG: 50S ribosomal protein L4 [Parcubacteria group bacterium 21-54-25]|nr:MAG: 50S ribosomal protein L4 [Parcubacteria group bacterium 21-54-25]HQU07887.1 50S ribosomal protein L4 [Candidatus Paceibacterota bacterium]